MSWEKVLKNDSDREMAERMWNYYQKLITKDKQGTTEIHEQRMLRNWQREGLRTNPNKEQFIQWYIETFMQPIEKVPFTAHPAWDVYEF